MTPPYTIRPPQPDEVYSILDLFQEEVKAGRMLPRSPNEMKANVHDWLVAATGEQIIGCVSLIFFDDDLCELRSLAVDTTYRGNGLGGALIQAALALAVEREAGRVLTLTRAVGLFEKQGFIRDEVANFPLKVWRDCRPCPFRHRCDEVALLYRF